MPFTVVQVSLTTPFDRTFDIVLDRIDHLFCAVVRKRLCSGYISGHSGPDPDLPGGQISPIG